MLRLFSLVLFATLLVGCQRAARYPAAPKSTDAKTKAEARPVWGWANPIETPRDLPIRFVASDRPEWEALSGYWNLVPHPGAGTRTIHIGQTPLSAALAIAAADIDESIVVKVPRGLPAPKIPASNPATFGKWRLGKKIFFDRVLAAGTTTLSCAECHRPDRGFTETNAISLEGTRNTLSLLNVAYNREQFWDGRVRDLEETLVRSLDDELEAGRVKVLSSHRWSGTARRLDRDSVYREEFQRVFGAPAVTQDAVAKSLATYLRTILSGDSLYDRARREYLKTHLADPRADLLKVEHFKAAMTDEDVAKLGGGDRDDLSSRIARGQAVFHGRGGCVVCHAGPLFTDRRYANASIDDSALPQTVSGSETGRFAALPIGLKDPSTRGAYRTPTLRNLPRTAPYFHTGRRGEIKQAIDHFRLFLDRDSLLLDPALREMIAARADANGVLFDLDDRDNLELYLRSLDGQPVDRVVAAP